MCPDRNSVQENGTQALYIKGDKRRGAHFKEVLCLSST